MSEPKTRHQEEIGPVEDRIVEAALSLVVEHGLGGVSMTGVATRAGIARQTLYSRYPDVDSIVAAALDQHNEVSLEQLRTLLATGATAADKIELLVRHSVGMAAAHGPELIDLHTGLSPQARQKIDQHDEAVRSLIAGMIADGIADGEFTDGHGAEAASFVVQGMLLAGVRLAATQGHPAAAAETTTSMILGALRPEIGG
jgi:AcrR family transcriptional regulator